LKKSPYRIKKKLDYYLRLNDILISSEKNLQLKLYFSEILQQRVRKEMNYALKFLKFFESNIDKPILFRYLITSGIANIDAHYDDLLHQNSREIFKKNSLESLES